MQDAPDWTEVVTGPGGTSVVVGAASSPFSVYFSLGVLGATITPTSPSAQGALASGIIRFQAFSAAASGSIGHISVYVSVGGTPTANENFFMVYDLGATTANTYTLLGTTAAGVADPLFTTAQIISVPLVTPVPVIGGQTYVLAAVINGSSRPQFPRQAAIDQHVPNLFGSAPPITANSNSAFTSPPSSVAFSVVTPQADSYLFWALP